MLRLLAILQSTQRQLRKASELNRIIQVFVSYVLCSFLSLPLSFTIVFVFAAEADRKITADSLERAWKREGPKARADPPGAMVPKEFVGEAMRQFLKVKGVSEKTLDPDLLPFLEEELKEASPPSAKQ